VVDGWQEVHWLQEQGLKNSSSGYLVVWEEVDMSAGLVGLVWEEVLA
jgi:hypothetical protein